MASLDMELDRVQPLMADNDVRRVRKQSNSTEVLFEVEPPNLFRDSSADLELASEVIRNLHADCGALLAVMRIQMEEAEQAMRDLEETDFSGGLIDGRYDGYHSSHGPSRPPSLRSPPESSHPGTAVMTG